jgi:hypothetical protein
MSGNRELRKYNTVCPPLFTEVGRTDADGDPVVVEVAVFFCIDAYWPGYPARLGDDPTRCWPAEPAEYDLSFVTAEITERFGDHAPLNYAELVTLHTWFDHHYDDACEVAANFRAAEDG